MPTNSFIKDLKSNILMATATGVLTIFTAAIIGLTSKALYEELKQPEFIFGLGLGLTVLVLTILVARKYWNIIWVKIIAPLTVMLILVTFSFAFEHFISKGLCFDKGQYFYYEFIIDLGLILIILSTLLVLVIKKYWNLIWVRFVTPLTVLIILVTLFFASKSFISKDLCIVDKNQQFFVVLYPNNTDNLVINSDIQFAINRVGDNLNLKESIYDIKKLKLAKDFEFDNSLIKQSIYNSNNVLGYAQLIPVEKDGENKILLKYTIPDAQPYMDLGLETIINSSYNNENKLGIKVDGYSGYFEVNIGASIEQSIVHYGLVSVSIYFNPSIDFNPDFHSNIIKLTEKVGGKITPVGDNRMSPLKPIGDGVVVNANDISEVLYLSLVKGSMGYLILIGEEQNDCQMLEDFFVRYDINKSASIVNTLFGQQLFSCFKSPDFFRKELLKFLPDKQVSELKTFYLRQLFEGKVSKYFASQTGLYEDNNLLTLFINLSNECHDLEFAKIQQIDGLSFSVQPAIVDPEFPVLLDSNLVPVKCLVDHISNDAKTTKEYPALKQIGSQIFFDVLTDWKNEKITDLTSSFVYVKLAPKIYRDLGDEDKACSLDWESVAFSLYFEALKQANAQRQEKPKENIDEDIQAAYNSLVRNISNIHHLSRCKNINVYGVNIDTLVSNPKGLALIQKITSDLTKGLKEDASINSIIGNLRQNLIDIVIFLNRPELQEKINNFFSFNDSENLSDWLLIKLKPLEKELEFLRKSFKLDDIANSYLSDFKTLSIADKSSKWISVIDKIIEATPKIDLSAVIKILIKGEDNFKDPLMNGFLDYAKYILDESHSSNNLNYNPNKISNSVLNQMLIFSKISSNDTSPEQRKLYFNILNNKYSKSNPPGRISHYKFLMHYKNGELKETVNELDKLIKTTPSEYASFYEFAKSIIIEPKNVKACPQNSNAAKKILNYFLERGVDEKYWQLRSGDNWFDRTLVAYLEAYTKDNKNSDLAIAFKSCKYDKAR